jgi:glucose-6-phosphate isomerase
VTLSVEVSARLRSAGESHLSRLVTSGFISALLRQDPTLWGPEAEDEASIRLGWTSSPDVRRGLGAELAQLREELAAGGIVRVVLCGMGGSSLGPEVMAAWAGLPLVVVDSTHPDQIAPELAQDLSHTVVVVSSKSGGTVETDSQKRAFEAALSAQSLDVRRHMVVVTDPGSPLETTARAAGLRVFTGDATIGGRFSALSPFGLVPLGLAGLDVNAFLDDALAGFTACSLTDETNPALLLGVSLSSGHPDVNKLLYRGDSSLPGFGDWIEQLVAESTGKDGSGLLPVVKSSLERSPDSLTIGPGSSGCDIEISGGLAEQIVLWEYATAVACAVIGVNPFDQPNVESAKVAARELLGTNEPQARKETAVAGVSVFTANTGVSVSDMTEISPLVAQLLGERGYLALCVFGPSADHNAWRRCADALEKKLSRPVTLGFGPRFLHSTGQLHKGAAPEGVFLQLIQQPENAVAIPGRDFDFGDLLMSQAHGDAQVLSETGQPVVSITGTAAAMDLVRSALCS